MKKIATMATAPNSVHLLSKRKLTIPSVNHESVKKRRKNKSQSKKVEPPTPEEINRLRETENVFHSNLFRMQIEEMLKEVTIKGGTLSKLNSWIEVVKQTLLNLDVSFSVKTSSDNEHINVPNVLVPVKTKSKSVDLSFTFLKPKSVSVIGSFNCNCVMKYSANIDIVVEMPKKMFQKEDYLNEKYLRKRNIYLSCIASKLLEFSDSNVQSEMKYILTTSFDKPLLQLKHPDEKLLKYCVLIHVVPEVDTFKESRFSPNLNNVRYGWYFDKPGDGKLNFPTPFYNSIVCQDLVAMRNEKLRESVFKDNLNCRDAYLLLKVWLHQRKLDEGLGSFSGFLMAMFVVYLYMNKKLNHFMSSYQIVRTVWVSLDQMNWHTEGISLANLEKESSQNSLEMFKTNYDITFIDVTGSTNLASVLSLSTYFYVKMQSRYAVQNLDNSKMNNFQALFMTPLKLTYEFDHIIYFNKPSVIRKVMKNNSDIQLQLDVRGDASSQFLKIILKLLKQALGQRVQCTYSKIEPLNLTWPVNEKMPLHNNIAIGLILDRNHAFNVIDKGPVANLPEASEFRKFWDIKAELRRFRDGDVCETVCWAKTKDTLQKKRLIVRDVVQFILDKKLGIQPKQYLYISDQMEAVVFNTFNEIFHNDGTGEELALNIINSFLELSKKLRELDNIPLAITSTQGSSAVFRYSELFPVLPNVYSTGKKGLIINNKKTMFKYEEMKHVPLYIPPIEVVIQFSSSSKWPNDLAAIRRLQAAFYIKLASSLSRSKEYICHPQINNLDVLKDGYVFRIRISNNNEITAVKRVIDDKGEVSYCDNAESDRLERTLIQLPVLSSAVHGLYQQYPAFGVACALAKRWLRSQLIDDYYLPDVCVDLIISYLTMNPQPYTPSNQPQTVFFRFLKFISTTNWFVDPIMINFNSELTREEILDLDSYLNKNRENLPALILVTPFDKSGTLWTREQPSLMIMKRLSTLAQATLKVVDLCILENESSSTLMQIFRPPLKCYDVVIWIVPMANSTLWFGTNVKPNEVFPIKNTPEFNNLPIVDFHPVRSYVNELRKHYSEFCLFFYDFYGGNFIGVVLKPETKMKQEFKISNMKCVRERKNKLEFDLEAVIDDFRILGDGIVGSIEMSVHI